MSNDQQIYNQLMEPVRWLDPEQISILINLSKQNAKKISYILQGISSKKIEKTIFQYGTYIRQARYRNIKNNRDLARQEYYGAIQKYLLGFYQDSLIQSCNSVEAALIIIHDENILKRKISRRDIKKPFTLGNSIKLATSISKGFIRDKNIIDLLKKIRLVRNGFIHQFNFLSTLISLYKSELSNLEKLAILYSNFLPIFEVLDISEINEVLDTLDWDIPPYLRDQIKEVIGTDYFKQFTDDLNDSVKVIKNLSDFNWASSIENKKFMKSFIQNFLNSENHMEFGFDIFHYYAFEILHDSFRILKYLDYF